MEALKLDEIPESISILGKALAMKKERRDQRISKRPSM
jgi:hypothetical protein